MAEDDTGLTTEQSEMFDSWLKDKWKNNSNCPICNVNSWIRGGHVITPTLYHPTGGVSIGGTTYPQVFIICSNCGHTHYFNAMVMGLFKDMEPKKEKEDG